MKTAEATREETWHSTFPHDNVYLTTNRGVLYNGDVLSILKTISSESVDCVVTSPPYWALRDYGVEGQLGLEVTFQEYLEKLWTIFDEVYRVLKPTGTCFVNLGDTYFSKIKGSGGRTSYVRRKGRENFQEFQPTKILADYSEKSLCLIPQRFAIGMVDRGWILRNDIIWYKPNALPESVKDRFTKSYEHVFFFVKKEKYHFEQILEPANYDGKKKDILEPVKKYGNRNYPLDRPQGMARHATKRWTYRIDGEPARNKRDVWVIPTKGFPEAHFAVFPEDLPETCIKAGCPKDGVVLDPFMGSGTTAVVAEKLYRRWIGIELNPEYCEIAEKRLKPLNQRLI